MGRFDQPFTSGFGGCEKGEGQVGSEASNVALVQNKEVQIDR